MLAPLTLETIPPEDEALRPKIRAFLDAELPRVDAAVRARSWSGYDEAFSRRLAAAGFVGLMLPTQYGGAGRSPFARFVVVEELLARGAPLAAHWIADRQSGPMIARFGTEAQRQFYLPRICRAEAFFCIGMSEPNSGSDLASIRSRAERVPGGWKLNGRKIWTTNAHHAHYMIALVRTSGTPEDRQRGLSQLIVDLKLPGITVRPIRDLAGDEHFNEVFFDDVMLPDDALIGSEGAGWAQVNAELAFERSGPERLLSSIVLLDELVAWLRATGRRDPVAAAEIGAIHARHVVLRAMSIAVTARVAAGEQPLVEAAVVKDLGTRVEQEIADVVSRLIGADPLAEPPPPLAGALAYVTQIGPTFSLRGGTREILRGMIARGMGLR
jgi:alkylation response protein AidB-like acyl-CoA dehydrogenase